MSSLEEGYCSFPDECVLFGLDALSPKTHDISNILFLLSFKAVWWLNQSLESD